MLPPSFENSTWSVVSARDPKVNVSPDGRALFSNYMVGPGNSRFASGFEALALYDRAAMGGDDNGVIDSNDTIFASLQLWRDVNRNGKSEPSELTSLAAAGLTSLAITPEPLDLRNGRALMTERAGNLTELWLDLEY